MSEPAQMDIPDWVPAENLFFEFMKGMHGEGYSLGEALAFLISETAWSTRRITGACPVCAFGMAIDHSCGEDDDQ